MAHLEYIDNLPEFIVNHMEEYRRAFIALHTAVEKLGKSRELSIALTEIENALMWTIKHLAIQGKKHNEMKAVLEGMARVSDELDKEDMDVADGA